jgi:tripartite-type tricarboxylate transporter receptor subunit TctC
MRKLLLGALLALTSLAGAATAQDFPNRTLTMVIPFAAGGPTDVLGRIIAARMGELLGQNVIVENVGGAGGMTGSARVAQSKPDGYTMVLGTVGTHAQGQTLYKKPLYNAASDFSPVALVAEVPIVLITRKDLPVNSMAEFVAYAKANHKQMQFGSSGVGSGSHFSCARLNAALGIEPQHVPYRGSGLAMQDLIAGRIDYFCALGAAAMGPLESDQAKAMALLTGERSPLFPTVKTAKELGYAGVDSYFWTAFFFPKDTPDAIVQKLHEASNQALNSPVTVERLKKAGVSPIDPKLRTPAYLKTFIGAEVDNWAAQIKASGVTIE